MKMPIPDDWSGEDWLCVQIQWPNSDKWLGILAGLITLSRRGRFWDERTGSVISAQQVGALIDNANLPFVDCAGETITTTETIVWRIANAIQEDKEMSLCGYNPKAFKIENGSLWVRDFCGEWVEIGALLASEDLPGEDIIPDPPPEGLQDSTSCAMANKLATFVYNIVVQAWTQIGTPELIDIVDYVSDMRDHFPGIDLAYNDLISLYLNIIPLDVAGLENESKNPEIVSWLACYYDDEITASNTGITSDEYEACKLATRAALKHAIGDDAYSGFGQQIRYIYGNAIDAIGPKDAQKITYLVQPTGLEDCSCPEFGDVEQPAIYFDGTRQGPQGTDFVVEAFEAQYNGRRIHIRISCFGAGNKHFTDLEPNLAGAQLGDIVKVRVYPTPGAQYAGVPAGVSGIDTPTITESQWTEFYVAPNTVGQSRVNGSGWVEFEGEYDPSRTPSYIDHEGWKYPISETQNVRFDYCIEIVGINGVALTPLGP